MSLFTSFLNLFKPGDNSILDITKIDENSDKIDTWASKVGDPDNLSGASKNIVTEVNANKAQIENLTYSEELVLIKDLAGTSGTFLHSVLGSYTEIIVTATGTSSGEKFSVRKDVTIFKQNLPNFKIVIRDDDQANNDYARLTTDGTTVTVTNVTGIGVYKVYGVKKTIS